MREVVFVAEREMASLEPNTWLSDANSANMPLVRLVAPSLVLVDPECELRPGLAERWELDDSGRRWRFVLRDDVVMHDGTPMDAALVAWNFERIFDPRVHSTSAHDLQSLVKTVAVDRRTVDFHFSAPFPAFPYHLPWSAHITTNSLIQPIGGGPYRVLEWRRNEHLLLERFDRYYEPGWPRIERLKILFAPHAERRLALIDSGEADIVEGVSAKWAGKLQQDGVMEVKAVKSWRKMIIAFNCSVPPFSDVRVRRAVAHAVDRESLRIEFFGAHAQPIHAGYPVGHFWAAEVEPYVYDPDYARHLIKAAGYDRIRVGQAIITNVSPAPAVGARIAAYLKAVGIDVELTGYEDPPWWPFVYKMHTWQLAIQNFPGRPHPEVLYRRDFGTGGAFNGTHYSNPKLDQCLAHARTLRHRDEQKRIYDDAQRILHEDVPVLPLLSPDVISGWRPGITGFEPHPLQYIDLTRLQLPGGQTK